MTVVILSVDFDKYDVKYIGDDQRGITSMTSP